MLRCSWALALPGRRCTRHDIWPCWRVRSPLRASQPLRPAVVPAWRSHPVCIPSMQAPKQPTLGRHGLTLPQHIPAPPAFLPHLAHPSSIASTRICAFSPCIPNPFTYACASALVPTLPHPPQCTQWFDDSDIVDLGSDWGRVIDRCLTLGQRPVQLFYVRRHA
jgi:hypothetical protein